MRLRGHTEKMLQSIDEVTPNAGEEDWRRRDSFRGRIYPEVINNTLAIIVTLLLVVFDNFGRPLQDGMPVPR